MSDSNMQQSEVLEGGVLSEPDADLRQRMLAYYDQRAPEYDEAYTLGTGTASITDPCHG